MKIRRSLDGKDRFAALLTAEDEELLEEVDKLVEKHEESKKYINFKDRDPAKELQDFLMSVKTQKGLGFMAKLIETATNEVVGKNAGMEKKKPIKVPRKPKK